jgi:hypothetical protein
MSWTKIFLHIFLISFVSLGLAQEEARKFTPPPPLNDEFLKWMVGEWRGISESSRGASHEWMKCELTLDGQFLLMNFKSEFEGGGGISGLGALTLNQTGDFLGLWIDSWRNISQGKGKREGNVLTMEWSIPGMGKQTRTIEKMGEDLFVALIKMKGKNGKEMQVYSEMRRVKKTE